MQGEANKKYGAQAYKLSEEVFTACTYIGSGLGSPNYELTFLFLHLQCRCRLSSLLPLLLDLTPRRIRPTRPCTRT